MAESTLSVNHAELVSAIARFMSFANRDDYDNIAADCKLEIDEIIDRGYRRFLSPPPLQEGERPHVWSFLTPVTTITTTAPYTTGTVTVALGVVTGSGTTFPSWAADGNFVVGGTSYSVDTRDGDTQLTLNDLTVTAAAGSSYSLERPDMDLPDNFGGIRGNLTYESETGKGPIQIIGEGKIRELRQTQKISTNYMQYAAVRWQSAPTGSTTGQRAEILFWPNPDGAYRLTYSYWVSVAKIDTTNTYPIGGLFHGETILAACLSVAEEIRERDSRNPSRIMMQDFMRRLAASVEVDQQATRQDVYGYNADRSDLQHQWRHPVADYNVTYDGTLYP